MLFFYAADALFLSSRCSFFEQQMFIFWAADVHFLSSRCFLKLFSTNYILEKTNYWQQKRNCWEQKRNCLQPKRNCWEQKRVCWEPKRICWEQKRNCWQQKRVCWEQKRVCWQHKRNCMEGKTICMELKTNRKRHQPKTAASAAVSFLLLNKGCSTTAIIIKTAASAGFAAVKPQPKLKTQNRKLIKHFRSISLMFRKLCIC